jgi:outer membrane protein assembly factor BamB
LAVDGLLFLWADEGIVTCVDAADGQRYWTKRVGGTYYGSPVAAGGAVYCASRDGEMIVLAADKEYRLLGRCPLLEGSHSTPAISGQRMYIRTFSHLISLGGPRQNAAR